MKMEHSKSPTRHIVTIRRRVRRRQGKSEEEEQDQQAKLWKRCKWFIFYAPLFLYLTPCSSSDPFPPLLSSPTSDFSYLTNFHWNTQTLVRLKSHERDYLTREPTYLLSTFAVHDGKKLMAMAEFSTELRLVTITIADIHAASEEEFTQIDLRSQTDTLRTATLISRTISVN